MIWVVVGLLLLLFGAIQVLYTQWFQDEVRDALVGRVNATQNVTMELDKLAIDFPLNVTIEGLSIVKPQNDTLVAANRFVASVSILPLLKGEIVVEDATLKDGRYKIGNIDSAMMMILAIDDLKLFDSKVNLSLSDVDLAKVDINGGRVDLTLRNDTTPSQVDTGSSPQWKIKAQNLNLKDFVYHMAMEPIIDSLETRFVEAQISDLVVDLDEQRIDLKKTEATKLNASYIASNQPSQSNQSDVSTSKPWTISVDTIAFQQSKALYTTVGTVPQPGLDFNYIQVDSLDVIITSFYNQASKITIPIKELKATERSGIELQGNGTFAIDNDMMYLQQFKVLTDCSHIMVDGALGMTENVTTATMALIAHGEVGTRDISKVMPMSIPALKGMPMHDKVELDINVKGAINDLTINKVYVDLAGRANVDAKGYIANVTDFSKIQGTIDLRGEIIDADFVNAFIADDADEMFVLPRMSLSGAVNLKPGLISGDVDAHTQNGDLALSAMWNNHSEGYDVDLKMSEFPIDAFLPRMGIGNVSGTLVANGERLNLFDRHMQTDVQLTIDKVEYRGTLYDDISATIEIDERNALLTANSHNRTADFNIVADCQLFDSIFKWDVNADMNNLDLQALKFMEQHANVKTIFNSQGELDVATRKMQGVLQIDALDWRSDSLNLSIEDINTKILATDTLINVALRNNDMYAFFSTPERIDSIATKIQNVTNVLTTQLNMRRVDVEQIQQTMPRFSLDVKAGAHNLLTKYLSTTNQSFQQLTLKASNDSLINIGADVLEYKIGTTVVDTIKFEAIQYDKILMYNASMGNRKGTLDEFAHVTLDGYIADDLVSAHLQQQNIAGEEGYNIGALAQVGDSLVRFELFPETPMLAYKEWDINDDNFIEYNMATSHVDANVEMKNAISLVNIYTEHNHKQGSQQEDLRLKIENLKLAELVAFNPYLPAIKGGISADMRVNWGGGQLNGNGVLSLNEFVVGKERVGSFVADVGVATDKVGQIKANASLMIDGAKTMSLAGYLNDSISQTPMMLDFSVIHFPLKVLNPMLPQDVASLTGVLNGEMKISGSKESPVFNGSIDFDSAAVMVAMTGTPLNFSEVKIPVENNVVSFNDFAISGVNKNPLKVNGLVDISTLSSPKIDLTLAARDMQIVGSEKSRRTNMYGKGYIDFDAKVKGNLSYLDVDASVKLLGGSNLTYIVPDATSAITSYSTEDMVKFVKFSDTTSVETPTQVLQTMVMDLDVALIVSEGTTINVDLSADGKNRVQLQGNGTLNYTLNALEDSRLTGRYTINKGFVRYTPPLMSEKLFNFIDGSYVAFNGDVLNPTLSLQAIDNIKANVTREGQDSRLVDFDVELSVFNSLNNMDVAFDLSTPNDIAIANELSSMSAEQRANQAMNMLLYNVYTGANSKGNSNFSGNPLYSFVESKLNTWAANNIGFVDISFGIDQYDKTTDGAKSKTTSYSYKVSKTLFNDRFKIVVGGNYSTDADADENYSQNLVNDISFEYMLNRSGTMYVKLFRQVGFESILEGEITQTGVGFVYRRKLKSLRDLFK